jgi:hypothetical protein
MYAAELPPGQLQQRRAFTLPAIRVSMLQLLRALAQRFPESRSQVAWNTDPQLEASFARQPPLTTAMADALGFRHDGSLGQLIAQALTQ